MIIINNVNDRPDSERGLAKYRNFDMIVIEELKEFVARAINKYGTLQLLEEANRVADRLIATYRFRGLITEGSHQAFVDLQVAAALLYNIFYNQDDWRTLFDARFYLAPIKDELEMHQQAFDGICRSIECQLGQDGPIPELKPNPNTPQELFADIVFHEKTYKALYK